MNYRLDKKAKDKRTKRIIIVIILFAVLVYFRSVVFGGLSGAGQTIFRPVLVLGNNIGTNFKSVISFFYSKKTLLAENENLKAQLSEQQANNANYAVVADENAKLKEMAGRKQEANNFVLSAILSKPNRSPYDTLVIDVGTDKNIAVGNVVFALGNVPVGRISNVYNNSAKVVLFSNPGEKTDVVVAGRDASMQLVGRGGGNFEMTLPRDFTIEAGAEVHLPGITPYVVGNVATIISDPRDAFTKALLVSPVNIQQLKFVEVNNH